jgi:hypothetical protein
VDYGRHPRKKNQLSPYVSADTGRSDTVIVDRIRLKLPPLHKPSEDPAKVERRRERIRKVLEAADVGDDVVHAGVRREQVE